jgi:acetate kinase
VDIAAFLKNSVPLFHSLPERDLADLVHESQVLTFEAKEAVIEYGEEGLFVGVLLEGEAEASVYLDTGRKKRIEILKPGDLFGEMSLMSGEKTVADVVGVTRCKAVLIPHSLLSEILVRQPDMVKVISEIIQARLDALYSRDRESLLKNALRKSLDPYGLSLKRPGPAQTVIALSASPDELSFSLYDTGTGRQLAGGVFRELHRDKSHVDFRINTADNDGEPAREQRLPVLNRDMPHVIDMLVDLLCGAEHGALAAPASVDAVGHHLICGGDAFTDAAFVTNETVAHLHGLNGCHRDLNEPGLAALREARRVFPSARHVAVFDSSFHVTLPSYANLYAVPYELFKEKGVKRQGFHGIAHQYAALKAAQYMNRPYNELEIAVCYLDAEASLCSVDHGRSVDVTAGFSPAEGLVSGTSPGSIDPTLQLYLTEQAGFSAKEAAIIVREQSGLRGLSGLSADMRTIEAHADKGHHRALLAYKLYCYSIRKRIGEAQAAMGGLDVLVFTGDIGHGSAGVRSLACQGLGCMGIRLDEKRNQSALETGDVALISQAESPVKILVVRPNRTLMLARETLKALKTDDAARLLKKSDSIAVPIEVSAHHVHLSREHIDALFGQGKELDVEHELSQPGQYASRQKVTLIGPKGSIERVRVLGPARRQTQVEIAMTEQFRLGIEPPVRESGDIEGSPGVTIQGDKGTVALDRGVICARRHIHMSPEEALGFGLHDKDVVRVRVAGDRELIFGDVLVRVNPQFRLAMHIDTDEANASHIKTGDTGYIEGIQSRQ